MASRLQKTVKTVFNSTAFEAVAFCNNSSQQAKLFCFIKSLIAAKLRLMRKPQMKFLLSRNFLYCRQTALNESEKL